MNCFRTCPKQEEILDISQKFFHRLAFSAACGVRVQRHYELFEYPKDVPDYPKAIKHFTPLSSDGKAWMHDENIPRRKDAKGIWGWYFNAFFAEGPTYLQQLHTLYLASGGMFIPGRIRDINEFSALPADVLVNCSGRWATEFFPEDKKNTKIIKGHMVKAGIHQVPHDKANQYFSYNYSPKDEVYYKKNKSGERIPADVYFYPRTDAWLLGGSRLEGNPEIGEAWRDEDEQIGGETYQQPGWDYAVPKPIWELNRELILDITKVDIADPKFSSSSLVGYRFFRNPIRIEQMGLINGKLLVHNYGHGGGGFTLSWGSAFEVLKLIESELGSAPILRKQVSGQGLMLSLLSILENLTHEEFIKAGGPK